MKKDKKKFYDQRCTHFYYIHHETGIPSLNGGIAL